jgi:hypothetical protein
MSTQRNASWPGDLALSGCPINPTDQPGEFHADRSRQNQFSPYSKTPLSGLFQRGRVFSHHWGFQAADFFRHGKAYKVVEGDTILRCH